MKRIFEYRGQLCLGLVAFTVAISLMPLDGLLSDLWKEYFCRPSAVAASFFMGCETVKLSDGYMLQNDIMPIYVTMSCSAVKFFFLLNAMLLGIWLELRGRMKARHLALLMLLTYPATLCINAVRIVLGRYVGVWAINTFPKDFFYGIHAGVGVIVFLFFIITMFGLLRWRYCYAAS